jgi:hypothetical protein
MLNLAMQASMVHPQTSVLGAHPMYADETIREERRKLDQCMRQAMMWTAVTLMTVGILLGISLLATSQHSRIGSHPQWKIANESEAAQLMSHSANPDVHHLPVFRLTPIPPWTVSYALRSEDEQIYSIKRSLASTKRRRRRQKRLL